MYLKNVYVNNYGNLVAETDFEGDVAFYLKSKGKFVEKKFYDKRSNYEFIIIPDVGSLSVVFFFRFEDGKIISEESEEFYFDSKKKSIWKLNSKVVSESNDFKITYYNQESDITFITFNGAHTTKKSIPFGFQYVIGNKWNLIAVAQDNDTQYQNLSLEEFFHSVASLLNGKSVFSYGSSLGGYCALYYGGIVNATIIAASPRNSAHPLIKDHEWRDLEFKHGSLEEIPLTTKPVYIVFDSNITVDTNFINMVFLPFYQNTYLLALPKASHNVLKCMLNSGVLTLYISKIINEEYNDYLAKYLKAKCSFYLQDFNIAFDILEDIVVNNFIECNETQS